MGFGVYKNFMSKKLILIWLVAIFILGGISSVIFERYLIPYFSNLPGLTFLRNLDSDSPIVINRREQIQIEDGVNTIELTKQAQNFTVSIFDPTSNPKLLGSGIILTSDGIIFTSRAMIGGNKEVKVVLNDGRILPGLVRALDRKSEIAVVTVDVSGLAVAQFNDAIDLQTGQKIIALGKSTNQFVRQISVGNITKTLNNYGSFEQILNSEEITETFLSSAVMINDFVGGPVINLDGRVVGMVSTIEGKILTAEGLNQALSVYLSSGKISRPYIGIKYLTYTKVLGALKNFPSGGILVTALEDNSPAKLSGLRVGDYITSVDGTKVEDLSFERLINRHQPGNIKLLVLRADQQTEISFEIQNQ